MSEDQDPSARAAGSDVGLLGEQTREDPVRSDLARSDLVRAHGENRHDDTLRETVLRTGSEVHVVTLTRSMALGAPNLSLAPQRCTISTRSTLSRLPPALTQPLKTAGASRFGL